MAILQNKTEKMSNQKHCVAATKCLADKVYMTLLKREDSVSQKQMCKSWIQQNSVLLV